MAKRVKPKRGTSRNSWLEKLKNRDKLTMQEQIDAVVINRMDREIKAKITNPDERKAYILALITAFGG